MSSPSYSSLIKTDQELFDAALNLFDEYDNDLTDVLNVPARKPSDSATISVLDDNEYQNPQDEDGEDGGEPNNNNYRKYQQQQQQPMTIEEVERRQALKWLHTIEQHNRNNTFSPAICQKSLELLQERKNQLANNNNRQRTRTPPSTTTPRNNNRNNNNGVISTYQYRVQERELIATEAQNQIEDHVDDGKHTYDDNFVSRLYYGDAQRRKEMEEERALQAEANRLLRQQELIRSVHNYRATTPRNNFTTSSTRNANNNNNNAITSPNPRTPNQKSAGSSGDIDSNNNNNNHQPPQVPSSHINTNQNQQSEPYRRQTSGSVGVSASERLYSLSQRRPVTPTASSSSSSAMKKDGKQQGPTAAAADPALFERLHSDSARMKEAHDQRVAEAYAVKTTRLDQYELSALVERVYDEAIEERTEHMKHLRKSYTPAFHPEIDQSSARIVGPRNSAAGDVFHRLAAKPPATGGEH